jgi:hypothetical protein
VNTARTPGAGSAAVESIPRIRACVVHERTITACAWPGMLTVVQIAAAAAQEPDVFDALDACSDAVLH